jgi:hypothetical protein
MVDIELDYRRLADSERRRWPLLSPHCHTSFSHRAVTNSVHRVAAHTAQLVVSAPPSSATAPGDPSSIAKMREVA